MSQVKEVKSRRIDDLLHYTATEIFQIVSEQVKNHSEADFLANLYGVTMQFCSHLQLLVQSATVSAVRSSDQYRLTSDEISEIMSTPKDMWEEKFKEILEKKMGHGQRERRFDH